jgi:hypothetical protein
MTWSVIYETGIDLDSIPEGENQSLLKYPTYAAKADDGTYLIVDELGKEKQLPFSFDCRTVRVDTNCNILYDTLDEGIDDGYGCLLDDGYMGILRRTKWELLIISPVGAVTNCLRLESFSKRLPRLVSWTHNQTLLIVFLNRAYDLDIVEIDLQGRLLWCLPEHVKHIGIAISVQLMQSNTILIADPIRHVAIEINRKGDIVWQFGETKHPSSRIDHLSSPCSIRHVRNGLRMVADTRNHRILLIDPDGVNCELMPHDGTLRDPTYADMLSNGNCLLCDTGNARIVELDEQGYIIWHYGSSIVPRRLLSYPRSVEVTESGSYLVADTAHDRIIEIHGGQISEMPFHDKPGMFWPRCVRALPSGSLLIADARNSRIIEVSNRGHVINQLTHIMLEGRQALKDPHDVRMLSNGHLLVTDSQNDLVIEVDWSGEVHQLIGNNDSISLDDPHSAQILDNGSFVIADTGHHRILVLNSKGKLVRAISEVYTDSSCFRLHHPRYAEVNHDGTMVIVDTGHNRILAATMTGRFIWECSRLPDSPQPLLNQPRWAKLIDGDEMVICDHFHHRILHVKKHSP